MSVELLLTAVSPAGGAAAPGVAAGWAPLSAASLTSAGSCAVNNTSLNQHRGNREVSTAMQTVWFVQNWDVQTTRISAFKLPIPCLGCLFCWTVKAEQSKHLNHWTNKAGQREHSQSWRHAWKQTWPGATRLLHPVHACHASECDDANFHCRKFRLDSLRCSTMSWSYSSSAVWNTEETLWMQSWYLQESRVGSTHQWSKQQDLSNLCIFGKRMTFWNKRIYPTFSTSLAAFPKALRLEISSTRNIAFILKNNCHGNATSYNVAATNPNISSHTNDTWIALLVLGPS